MIGAGFGARAQIPGLRAAGFEVTALAAATEREARDAAASLGVPYWTADPTQLIELPQVEVVSVATPPYLHLEHVMAVVTRRKHVMCEKPFALDLEQARQMFEGAQAAGVANVIDLEMRFVPARAKLRTLIERGDLGQVRGIDVVEYTSRLAGPHDPKPAWWIHTETGGGLLGATASHWIDAVEWWTASPVSRVFAQLDTFVDHRDTPDQGWSRVTADDTVSLSLRTASGVPASVRLSCVALHEERHVRVLGSSGTALILGNGRLLFGRAGAPIQELLGEPPADVPDGAAVPRFQLDAFIELARRARRALEGDASSDLPTFVNGLRTQRVLDAARASAKTGRAIDLPEIGA